MKIAVLGPAGTFCDKACSDYITTDYDGNDQLKPVVSPFIPITDEW